MVCHVTHSGAKPDPKRMLSALLVDTFRSQGDTICICIFNACVHLGWSPASTEQGLGAAYFLRPSSVFKSSPVRFTRSAPVTPCSWTSPNRAWKPCSSRLSWLFRRNPRQPKRGPLAASTPSTSRPLRNLPHPRLQPQCISTTSQPLQNLPHPACNLSAPRPARILHFSIHFPAPARLHPSLYILNINPTAHYTFNKQTGLQTYFRTCTKKYSIVLARVGVCGLPAWPLASSYSLDFLNFRYHTPSYTNYSGHPKTTQKSSCPPSKRCHVIPRPSGQKGTVAVVGAHATLDIYNLLHKKH